jgi:hypothetical protein
MPARTGDGFDVRVADAMTGARCGAMLLLELAPPWPLQVRWLARQLEVLEPRALLHDGGDVVLAVVAPGLGADEGWILKERLLERAEQAHLRLLVGLATWPVQGSSPTEVVAAAAAALLDEHANQAQQPSDEARFILDGDEIYLGVAGVLLTG